ncbi:restriction endonuclease [Agrococcus carbonis]|nr:restriction endonuclease [Agrococcus carbonis]
MAVEVGRLSAPLAPASDAGNFGIRSRESAPAVDALTALVQPGVAREPLVRFDERAHQYVEVSAEQLASEASRAIRSSFAFEVRAFFRLFRPALSERDRAASSQARARLAELSRTALHGHYDSLAGVVAERSRTRTRYEGRGDAPPPQPQKYGVTATGAEHWVRDAAHWLGARNARVTPGTGDGGVDVLTDRFAISVKHYAGYVPVEEVREIFAVAVAQRRSAMLWTSGKVTKAGLEFARVAPVHVVHYDVATAEITPITDEADEVLRSGLD